MDIKKLIFSGLTSLGLLATSSAHAVYIDLSGELVDSGLNAGTNNLVISAPEEEVFPDGNITFQYNFNIISNAPSEWFTFTAYNSYWKTQGVQYDVWVGNVCDWSGTGTFSCYGEFNVNEDSSADFGDLWTFIFYDDNDYEYQLADYEFDEGSYIAWGKDFVAVETPLPAAAWLFGSALIGFMGFSRRKAQAKA
jgi:hypothetical protein